ncbi:MAG: hypothetical protein ACREQI_04150 [Candidatus Binataceae bacterium]
MRMNSARNAPGRIAALTAGAAIAVAIAWSAGAPPAIAAEAVVPETAVVPAEAGAAKAPAPLKPLVPKSRHAGHRAARASHPLHFEVEPASARLQLLQNGWAYEEPWKSSRRIQSVTAGKFVNVTGSTRYYLRVKLKSGKTAYVEQSAADMVRPLDKIWRLTKNAAVLDKPNKWAKKRAEVHRGHNVRAIGLALNYVKIRMKSGLEGFIPIGALE